jgi:ribosomal protein S18 acetylase RimI-like enzyme
LTEAFLDDPLYRCMFPQEAERKAGTRLFMECIVRCSLDTGRVMAGSDGRGAACWLAEGGAADEGALRPETASLLARAACTIPMHSLLRALWLYRVMAQGHCGAISRPHWYLWAIGVHPQFQHSGLGTELLRASLEEIDAAGLPAYLETAQSRTVGMYEQFGFRVVFTRRLLKHGVTLWCMVREPRA